MIAIVAGLVALLLPALERAREAARFVQCAAQQRQIYQAATVYATDNDDTLPGRDGIASFTHKAAAVEGYPRNPDTGRPYAHGSRIFLNDMALPTGHRLDAVGRFMERYADSPLRTYTPDGHKKEFREVPNVFHCPSSALPPERGFPPDGMRRATSYFLAGFGAAQLERKIIYGRTEAGSRDYPVGWPRLSWIEPIDGKRPGMLLDMFNHAPPRSPRQGRGNVTARDGSVTAFSYENAYVLKSVSNLLDWGIYSRADIYAPDGFAFAWIGHHENSDYFQPIKRIRYYDENGLHNLSSTSRWRRFGYSSTGR